MNDVLFLFITLIVIFYLFSVDSQNLQSYHDIDFKIPHVIIDYDSKSLTTVKLEAFTTKNLKQIEAEADTGDKYSRLTWMSLGYPALLETKQSNNDQSRIFHFSDEGFFTFIETLNNDYKNAFARALFVKYSLNVSSTQIVNIPLAYFGCQIILYNKSNLKNVSLFGQVKNFSEHPYKLIFKAPSNSTERRLFEEKIKNMEKNISIDCKVKSQYNDEKISTFELTPKELIDLKLSDNIFDKNDFVYLTKYQIDSLSKEIYSSFDILDISENEFNITFYDEFLTKVYLEKFSKLKFEHALKYLSKYSLNIDKNISIEKAKMELSKLFKVNQNGNNSFISVDNYFVDTLRE